ALRPSRALVPADAPRVEVLLDVPHRLSRLRRHLALREGHVPTHLDDLRDVLVHHGALVHAGVAGRTRPDSLLRLHRLEHARSAFLIAPLGVRSMKNVFTLAKMMCMCFE